MTPKLKPVALVDPKRFKTIQDLTRLRPDCGASIDDIFVIDNESLFIIDLSNLGSLLNPYSSPEATYVRSHGVVVGDRAFSNFSMQKLKKLIPLSYHLKGNHNIYSDMANIVGSVSCPSGSILLLPFRLDIPIPVNQGLDDAITGEIGVEINLPNGNYRVFYEQFETPEGAKEEFYRNIAVQKQ